MENQPKISTTEAYYLIVFAIIADLINWIPIVNFLVTAVTLPGFQFYFKIKGVKGIYSLAGNLAELIPVVSILPAITAGVITTIIVDRVSARKGAHGTLSMISDSKNPIAMARTPIEQ